MMIMIGIVRVISWAARDRYTLRIGSPELIREDENRLRSVPDSSLECAFQVANLLDSNDVHMQA